MQAYRNVGTWSEPKAGELVNAGVGDNAMMDTFDYSQEHVTVVEEVGEQFGVLLDMNVHDKSGQSAPGTLHLLRSFKDAEDADRFAKQIQDALHWIVRMAITMHRDGKLQLTKGGLSA